MAKSVEDSGSKSASIIEMGLRDVSASYDETRGEVHEIDHLSLKRQLRPRHISMLAAQDWPKLARWVYSSGIQSQEFFATSWATWLPLGSGFTGYATRFVDPALGFSLGWCYLCKYALSTANQLTSMALVLQYWVDRDTVNPGVFIAIFWVVILFINYFGVRIFGEAEFWLSSLKVVILMGIIILSIILAAGGGPTHHANGFKYWVHPGAIKPYIMTGATGRFLSVWNSLTAGVFAYLGTELVGVTVGEAQNPRKTIPRAIKLTFWRISVFYILAIFLLGLLVPYNSPELLFANKQGKTAAASPFVVAVQLAGIKTLPSILNGCILVFNFSAANSDLYIAARTLYGLALQRYAPRRLAYTDSRGVPIWSLLICSLLALLAFMNISTSSKTVFGYFVTLSVTFGLLTWITILVSYICFIRARRAQGIPSSDLAYTAPFGIWGTWISLFFCILVCLTKSFAVFTGNLAYKDFITGYLAIPIYLGLIFGWKLWHKTKGVNPAEADLFTGKERIDREEAEFLSQQSEKQTKHPKLDWFYQRVVGWLF
ncbi:hypothetical protein G7046_g490 [Stylonectria norvegica]|nr:hypothetical protein G7046_g490 [Stylonectria norvegica]